MEMVRQDADSVRCKWPACVDRTISLLQACDMFDKEFARPIRKHDREKEYPAFNVRTPISRHRRIIAREADSVRKIALTPRA